MKPGREIGDVLQKMLNDVIEDPEANRKDILMERFGQGRYRQTDCTY